MWEAIKTRKGADCVKEARLQTIITDFKNLKMLDNGTIDEYATTLSGIASKSATLEEAMSKHKFEDVVGRLKAYEERVKEEDKANDPQENLLYARIEYSNGNNDSSEGRGRNYSYFSELDENIIGRVRFGDGSFVSIKGKGSILFQGFYEEQKLLKDVYSIPALRSPANRLYKAQLKVGKEDTNEVGRESRMIRLPLVQLETVRLLIALAAGKGWKIHYLDVKTAFLHGELKEEMYVIQPEGFKKPREEEKVYKLAKSLYGLRQAPWAWNIKLDNTIKDLKLSKAEDEPKVEATQYRKVVGCLRYLLHTRLDLTYSVGVVSRYMQSPIESHAHAIKQILGYLKGTTSTTRHVFYLGTSPVTWCSQKQTIVALSSCEVEFMAATTAACQAIWLRELLAKVTGLERQKVIIRVDNKSAIALSKNLVFHGRSKHIHTRYHFIRECMENEQVIDEHVSGENQRANPLTKALARIRFKEMRSLLVSFARTLKPNVLVSSSNDELLRDQGVRGIYWPSFAEYPASTINTSYFSHIYYVFVRPSPTTYVLNITDSDVEKLLKFANSSSRWNPPAKTLLAIRGFGGGALSDIFSQMASQENSRATFINSTIKVARDYNFDAIDLNWEFLTNSSDMWYLGLMFKEWHQALESEANVTGRPRQILTSTVYYAPTISFNGGPRSYPINEIYRNVKSDVSWRNVGMYAKKIVMGLPLYGATWRLQDPNVNTIGSRTTGDSWISYDDVRSIESKVQYARDLLLGGYFFWALGQDLDWTLSSKASQAKRLRGILTLFIIFSAGPCATLTRTHREEQ
nr:acidic mammalian chitinase-like [Tanacetum cinerariifolium]